MPYVNDAAKQAIDTGQIQPRTRGELNYAITRLLIQYVERRGLGYTAINDVLGALTGASNEFYRRVAVPYENAKIRTNGDVYPRSIAPEIAKAKSEPEPEPEDPLAKYQGDWDYEGESRGEQHFYRIRGDDMFLVDYDGPRAGDERPWGKLGDFDKKCIDSGEYTRVS